MQNQKIFIAIAGNIGAGKTTLTEMLSKRFGWTPHFEAAVNNPYLSDFYKDMNRWAFPLQVYFLHHRFQAHSSIAPATYSSVIDRSIYEDAHIFARNLFDQGLMAKRDYENYLNLYQTMIKQLSPPDLMVYVRKSIPVLKKRIQLRGRDFEQDIPDSYLESLNHYYDDWMNNYKLGKKLIIESDHLDFLNKKEDFDTICKSILSQLDQGDWFLRQLEDPKTAQQ